MSITAHTHIHRRHKAERVEFKNENNNNCLFLADLQCCPVKLPGASPRHQEVGGECLSLLSRTQTEYSCLVVPVQPVMSSHTSRQLTSSYHCKHYGDLSKIFIIRSRSTRETCLFTSKTGATCYTRQELN